MTALLDQAMVRAADALRRRPAQPVRLFHHNDADGLSSGAILMQALIRDGRDVRPCCLEKPYPPVLARIFEDRDAILVFADFGGQIAPLLSRLNQGRNLVLILDHHPAREATDPRVHNLDPALFGLRGDRDVSASTTCFRFAEILDPQNRDLAVLAVIGAVGDGFLVDGRLAGLNRRAAKKAADQGQIVIHRRPDGDDYLLSGETFNGPVAVLAADLDILGGMGFFRGGPAVGLRVCLEGFDAAARSLLGALTRLRRERYRAEIERLAGHGLNTTGHIQWFRVADRFDGMGVKMIGDFCRHIRARDFVSPKRYIAGFQPVPDRVPGLGAIDFQAVKVSMRVPPVLEARILNGERPGLDRLLPEATRAVGGFVDACHSLAAATTIPPGSERRLVAALDRMAA
jgi:hypothetical protein